jgi:hypothetical protein
MFNIGNFLNKFSKKIQVAEFDTENALRAIEEKTGLKISLNNIEIKNNTIYIQASPAIKNKIFIFKQPILEEINKNLQVKILDIR